MNVSVRQAHATTGISVSTQLAPTTARGTPLTAVEGTTSMRRATAVLVRRKNSPFLHNKVFSNYLRSIKWFSFLFASLTADIDECKDHDKVCTGHGCVNLIGSFRCECEAGYVFNSISRICEGKQRVDYVWCSYTNLTVSNE